EDVLAPYPVALQGALGVMSRADHAAHYARAIAGLRFDVEVDEIVISALLHDLAELLLWATAPRLALQLEHMVRHMPGLRSATAQKLTLGFTLVELELALARAWNLPNLFLQLLDDHHADKPRVLSVTLSVALARHSAHGWYDEGIPHDTGHIEKLVTGQADQVNARIRWAAVQAARNWQTFGVRPALAWLPMLPGAWPAEEEAVPALGGIQTQIAEQVIEQLAASDPRHCDARGVAACLFFALAKGLGLRRLWWGEVNPVSNRVETKYVLFTDAGLFPNELSFGLNSRHLFAQVMQRQQGLWATKTARPKLMALIPPPLSERLAIRDFFAFSMHVKNAPAYFLFADAGRAGRELDEARYTVFKRLGIAAGQALAHTMSATTEAALPVR
ncbi:MAG: HDOD domain-containing protein, partial [Burkholderiales bacterium]